MGIDLMQTSSATSGTNPRDYETIGQKVKFSKDILVTDILFKIGSVTNSASIKAVIYQVSDGLKIAESNYYTQAINTQRFTLNSPVILKANTEYILGIYNNTTSILNYSFNSTLNDTISSSGLQMTYVDRTLSSGGGGDVMPTGIWDATTDLVIGVSGIAVTNGKIKDQAPGTVMIFAGSQWIILDPIKGYLLKYDLGDKVRYNAINTAEFNVSNVNNIGWYLNNTFYNKFTALEKSIVLDANWTISYNPTVSAKVGMITSNDWSKYSKNYGGAVGGLLENPSDNFWLLNLSLPDAASVVNTNGIHTSTIVSATNVRVRPALYINPEQSLVNGSISYNAAPTVTLNITNNRTLYENDIIQHYNKTDFSFNIKADDSDIADTLQYSVWLNNAEKNTWMSIDRNVDIPYSVSYSDMLTGNNVVAVKVKDNNGGENIVTFTLRNLTPES